MNVMKHDELETVHKYSIESFFGESRVYIYEKKSFESII